MSTLGQLDVTSSNFVTRSGVFLGAATQAVHCNRDFPVAGFRDPEVVYTKRLTGPGWVDRYSWYTSRHSLASACKMKKNAGVLVYEAALSQLSQLYSHNFVSTGFLSAPISSIALSSPGPCGESHSITSLAGLDLDGGRCCSGAAETDRNA